MKIAYIISDTHCISPFNGIRVQAETWADELIRQGNQVIRVNPWEKQDWNSYDVIHIFSNSNFLNSLNKIPNKNIAFSPIIDSFEPIWKYRLATFWGNRTLRLTSNNYTIRQASPFIKRWYVRSMFEYRYVHDAYGIPSDKISIVPLSYRIEPPKQIPIKDSYCLHVSKITDGRKNVKRLVDAAIKYQFRLVLAGSTSPNFENSRLKEVIDANSNVIFLGRVSDEKLLELYNSAKVFALPSIGEGVGLVAVEAAACGCDIVVTNIGGPKEYYDGMAFTVNPKSVDEIGQSVVNAMNSTKYQPSLMNFIQSNFSLHSCVNKLIQSYELLITE